MLYFVSWLTDFTANQLVFTVTRGLAELRTAPLQVGLVGASFAMASTLCNPVSGYLSDRFGRRVVAFAGAAMLFVSLLTVSQLAVDHWGAMAAFTLGGAAVGMIYPPVIAWLSQGLYGKFASRAFLIFCVAFNLGVICGQQTAGWLYQNYGASAPLFVGMGATGLIALLLFVTPAARSTVISPASQLLEGEEVERARSAIFARVAWIANFGGTFSYSIVLYHFPRLAVSLDIPAETHGAMLAGSRAVILATFIAMHLTTFWRHRLATVMTVQSLACGGLTLLAVAKSVPLLTLGLASLSTLIGCNYFASLYYTTTGSAEHVKGRATGIHEATLAFGLAAGSLCGGLAGAWFTPRAPFWLAVTVVGALIVPQLIVHARLTRRRHV
ncbi:MAG: MFS transporter [Planctomycetaceae bacterium]